MKSILVAIVLGILVGFTLSAIVRGCSNLEEPSWCPVANAETIVVEGKLTNSQREYNKQLWEDRQSKIKAIVDNEIERKRALELESAKIEVLGRLQMLSGSKVNVSVTNKVQNEVRQVNKQVNENA